MTQLFFKSKAHTESERAQAESNQVENETRKTVLQLGRYSQRNHFAEQLQQIFLGAPGS